MMHLYFLLPLFKGYADILEGFHHFNPDQAKSILRDAVEKKAAIAIFEASLKLPMGWLILILSPLITLFAYLLITPFIKPRTLSRFFWTYPIPIVPLATCWDRVISLLRVYSIQELMELTERLQENEHIWEVGQVSTGTPLFVFTYLLGYPV